MNGAFNSFNDSRMIVCQLVYPLLVHVLFPRPPVLKGSAGCQAIRGCVEITAFVERWIGGD